MPTKPRRALSLGKAQYRQRKVCILDVIRLNLGWKDAKNPFLSMIFGKSEPGLRGYLNLKLKWASKSAALERQFDLYAPRRAASENAAIRYDDFYLFY